MYKFGIRLGHSPLMLLLPTAAIAFAATAFGLVIAVVARTRDSVLPLVRKVRPDPLHYDLLRSEQEQPKSKHKSALTALETKGRWRGKTA